MAYRGGQRGAIRPGQHSEGAAKRGKSKKKKRRKEKREKRKKEKENTGEAFNFRDLSCGAPMQYARIT